jgi:hypothetical protein
VVASRGIDGRPTGAWWQHPAPSFDGTKVAFSGSVEPADVAILVHDFSTRQTRTVYRTSSAVVAFGADFNVSDDATVVSFRAPNINGDVGWHLYRKVGDGPPTRVDHCFFGSNCELDTGEDVAHDLSGSGSKVIYIESANGSQYALLYDAATGATTNLTPSPIGTQYVSYPLISGDGTTWAAMHAVPPEPGGIVLKGIASGPPTQADLITRHLFLNAVPHAINRDGNLVAYWWGSSGSQYAGHVHRRGSGAQRLPELSPDGFTTLDISDNGRALIWSEFCPSQAPTCPLNGMRLG